jgi:SAM-dependent methyltransferase
MSHVIEHVHDPVATLGAVFSLLRPGGFLYVDTPNIDALGHESYGRYWRGLEPPRHLVLFNRNSLRDLLRAQGFETIRSKRRPDVIIGLAEQSARLAAGLDPYGNAGTKRPPVLALRVASALSANGPEFLTLTCRKRA